MTISQRKSSMRSSIRAPKFLDKSSGFYGRLEEPKSSAAETLTRRVSSGAADDPEVFNEDDGEMLLRRKASRRSGRWRSLRRKDSKEERRRSKDERSQGSEREGGQSEEVTEVMVQVQLQCEEKEAGVVPEEADDRVLLRGGAEPEEQEEAIKALKRKSSKNYRKALDRAFRRGWEAFITNLYSVTLAPSAPDSTPSAPDSTPSAPDSAPAIDSFDSSPTRKKRQHSRALAEMH